ncbi:MAG TPA: PRC-barrel domain-containing protein [Paucimonas sp.]|nr:PRC-barrel domain-containing protein [Paucimonas sp.]
MKTSLQMTVLAIFLASAFGPALADNEQKATGSSGASGAATQTQTGRQTAPRSAADDKVTPDLGRASKLIGTDVVDAQGRKIGDIQDIVLDRTRGQVAYAVVSFGGTLGVGSKYFAIPWQALRPDAEDKLVLNVDREKLRNAPGFDKDRWPDMASEQWNTETARYYNQRPYWEGMTAARRGQQSSGSSGESDAAERGERSGASSPGK